MCLKEGCPEQFDRKPTRKGKLTCEGRQMTKEKGDGELGLSVNLKKLRREKMLRETPRARSRGKRDMRRKKKAQKKGGQSSKNYKEAKNKEARKGRKKRRL